MEEADNSRYRDYRAHVEGDLLAPALRNAILIFFLLQTSTRISSTPFSAPGWR